MTLRLACAVGLVGAIWCGCAGCREEQPAPPTPPPAPAGAPSDDPAPTDEEAASAAGPAPATTNPNENSSADASASASAAAEPAGQSPAAHSPAAPAELPSVVMSMTQRATILSNVGEELPAVVLPDLQGATQELWSLYGSAATVVFFWRSDNPHSLAQLADCGPDVLDLYGAQGVAVVGVNTGEPAAAAQAASASYGAKFPLLSDADGAYLAQLSTAGPPRVFVLDAQGKIAWFDIEYSRATREKLDQALRYLAAQAGAVAGQ